MGFGRIGRLVMRAALLNPEVEVVAINDLTDAKTNAHLFKYDSIHGTYVGDVTADGNDIVIDGKKIKVFSERDPKNLGWGEVGAEIVIESTGFFRTREAAMGHIEAGAKKVIISAPAKNEDITIVMGVNEDKYDKDKDVIISNASCTTNCLAPVAKVLNDTFGIKRGLMTTIHSYTNDQKILDQFHSDLRRARAAGENMIPTTTGAAAAVSLVLPELKDKLNGMAIRVPTPNVSLVDLVLELDTKASVEEINAALRRLEPIELEVSRLIRERNEKIPRHEDLTRQLIRIEDLPTLEVKHKEGMAQLDAVKSDEFEQLEQEIYDLRIQEKSLATENTSILRKGGIGEIRRTEQQIAGFKDECQRREHEFFKIQKDINIYTHQARYSEWKTLMNEQFPALDVQRKEFARAAQDAEHLTSQTSADLKIAMADFKREYHPKFDDLPDVPEETGPYEKILLAIEDADIPSYEKKSKLERKRWESLFRTQVLSRMQQALNNVENIISLLNVQLKQPIGHDRYKIVKKANPDFKIYQDLITRNALHHEDELFYASMGDELKQALKDFLQILTKNSSSPEAARLLDYRQYFDYDLYVTDIRDPQLKPVSVDKQSGKMSGGENQSPYFVAILASYLHAYKRHETRGNKPSLALVPIDEAFSKLSGERIQNCINAMSQLDLQGMFSMSSGNIPYAFSQCDELIIISRKEERRGSRVGVRNIPVVLFRESEEGQAWMNEHAMDNSERIRS